jgi:4-hydroxy-tetrahydrodipicolinate reductase
MSAGRYRVVQWGTGNIGLRALREVIRHPDLDLVGVLVYDPAKAEVDAGTLCGEEPVGIRPTTDRAAIRELKPDCVLYMPGNLDLEDVVGLLAAGSNVVTTRGEFFGGAARLGDDLRTVLDACEKGGTSIYATGSSPGFSTDALPFALISMQRRVDLVEINEYANMSRRDSPHMIFKQMGFGSPVGPGNDARAQYLLGEFGPPLGVLAEAAGRPVDRWTSEGSVAAARQTTVIAAGEIPAGTVAAQRTTITGYAGDEPIVRMTTNWYCTEDVDPAWELLPTGWRIRVRGDTPMDVTIGFPVPLEEFADFTPGLTANRPVNAVPYVCQAAPGVLSTSDLPHIVPTGPVAKPR